MRCWLTRSFRRRLFRRWCRLRFLHGALWRFGPHGRWLCLGGTLRQLASLRRRRSLRRCCALLRRALRWSLGRATGAGRCRCPRRSLGAFALRTIGFLGWLLLLRQQDLLTRLGRRRAARQRQQHKRRNNRTREKQHLCRRPLSHGHLSRRVEEVVAN